MKEKIPYKIYLSEDEIPRQWINVKAFMKEQHAPFLNPATGKPCTKDDLRPVFCDELIDQELDCTHKYIDIPEEIVDFYKMYRPSPLVRAYVLEKALGTPAKIYYKFEGNNTSGSHKLNSAVAQAYYAKKQGITSVTTEVGRRILAEHPGTGGSLGCAISEAIEVATHTPNCRYVLGSVLDHVLLHQSVIGLEAKAALDKYGVTPDLVIGCAGGGSNLGGLISPFMADRLEGKTNTQFLAVEPASCPSLTRGVYAYDFCDTGKTTPLAKMYTLGSGFMPSPNHAGGLRYHGMSPVVSKLYHDGYIKAVSYEQTAVFAAAEKFARTEGILPAPESSHAIKAAIDEALRCKETGEEKTILFGLTGTGYFDMTAYKAFNDGTMTDYVPTDEDLARGFESLPKVER